MRDRPPPGRPDLAGARRILVSRLRFAGDLVLVTPLLRVLRELAPRAVIGFLAEARYGELLRGHPDVDSLILAPAGEGGSAGLRGWLGVVRTLRRERFQILLDLFANPRSALLARLSGAPVRVGGGHGLRRRLFTHHPRHTDDDRTAVDHHLAHLRPLGVMDPPRHPPRLRLSGAELRRATERLAGLVDDLSRPLMGLHPGASWLPKRWPMEYFAAAAEPFMRERGAHVLVTHGPGEEELARSLAHLLGASSTVMPPLPWRELAGVLSLCDVCLSNDCGPMHVAAAVGTPTVGVFGPSDPRIWFPYRREDGHRAVEVDFPCRPCPGRKCAAPDCMRNIRPEAVTSALAEAWRASDEGKAKAAEREDLCRLKEQRGAE